MSFSTIGIDIFGGVIAKIGTSAGDGALTSRTGFRRELSGETGTIHADRAADGHAADGRLDGHRSPLTRIR